MFCFRKSRINENGGNQSQNHKIRFYFRWRFAQVNKGAGTRQVQNSDWIISFILLGKQWELLSGKSLINEEIRSELQRKAKKEDILLTLKMGHRAKNKIFGELNVFSLAINESYIMNSPGLSAILDFTEQI